MSDPSADDISAVRFLVGDPDTGLDSTHQLSDAEILFALDQTAQNLYAAAAVCARALAARYARKVDSKFETVESKYSQLRDNYLSLARTLEIQSRRQGGGLGVPLAGGISKADVDAVHATTDLVKPYFRDNLLNNPPPPNE